MQAFAEANRQLKHAFIRSKDDDVASGVQNGRADLAVLEMLLNIQPNILRQCGIQIVWSGLYRITSLDAPLTLLQQISTALPQSGGVMVIAYVQPVDGREDH
jgi:hypothetical protein